MSLRVCGRHVMRRGALLICAGAIVRHLPSKRMPGAPLTGSGFHARAHRGPPARQRASRASPAPSLNGRAPESSATALARATVSSLGHRVA